MRNADLSAFITLFKEACEKCFGSPLMSPLSEPESRRMSDVILERTGLVIGWKSIKNYSVFALQRSKVKRENPSLATLDTFARYLLDAPKTDEVQRQGQAERFPYWFRYRETHAGVARRASPIPWTIAGIVVIVGGVLVALLKLQTFSPSAQQPFDGSFHSVDADSLSDRGWILSRPDPAWWSRRGANPGYLTLYTMRGDTWPDSLNPPSVRNLLLREIPYKCFVVETGLSEFVPQRNWEQAGIFLLEDTTFAGRCVRLSLAYNDFAGGFPRKREILIQAITSMGKAFEKPEEVVHTTLFTLDGQKENLVSENLRHTALRIEKEGRTIRFLYAAGPMENAAFKELARREFSFEPKYVGLFALKGFVDDTTIVPVKFSSFRMAPLPCGE